MGDILKLGSIVFSLALLSSTALASGADLQYTSIWSVGDSLSDTGRTYHYLKRFAPSRYVAPKGPNYDDGRFSNGRVWLEYLAANEGLPYVADHNLSWGGAVTGTAYRQSVQTFVTHLEAQVDQFANGLTKTTGWLKPTLSPASQYGAHPLVTLWIGGNNFRQPYVDADAFDTFPSLLGLTAEQLRSPTFQRDLILKNIPADLAKMNAAFEARRDVAENGVTYMVLTLPDASTSPKFKTLAPDDKAALSDAITSMNRSLKESMYALGTSFAAGNALTRMVVVDAAALFKEIQSNPAAYGFTDVQNNCVDSETGNFVNGCSKTAAETFLFWDQFHPTTAGHAIIAAFAMNSDRLDYGAPVTLTMPHVANIDVRDETYAGVIGGTGSLIKQGEATLTLAGLNTYQGGTRVDEGLVRISTDDNLGARSGLLTLRGGGISASGSFQMTRNIAIGEEGGTFHTDAGALLTLTGNTVSGDGNLTKTGAGTLDIRSTMDTSANGQSEAVKGQGRQLTTLAGGTLKINSATPFVTYRLETLPDTVLGGSGTIVTGRMDQGGGIVAAGLIAPGNSIGTLTINGDLTLTDNSVYHLEVDPTRADQLVVTGALALDGTVRIVTDPTDKLIDQTLTFVTSTGTMAGTYDEVVDLSPFLSQTLHYVGNRVSVTFARDFAAPATTANQKAVASALNAAYRPTSQGDLDNVFYGLDTTDTVSAGANALDQLSGVSIGNLLTASAIQQGQFTRALEDRLSARRAGRDAGGLPAAATGMLTVSGSDASGLGGALAAATGTLQDADVARPGRGGDEDGVSAWARVLGGPGSIGGPGSFDMTGVGVMLGMDKSFGSGLAGISFAYGSLNMQGTNTANGSADTYQVSLYGALQSGNLFLDATASYAHADYSTTRALAFGALQRVATGSADGDNLAVSLKAGGVWSAGALTFEPSLGFDWYRLTRSAFAESGAGAAGLDVASKTLDLILPSIGARLSSRLDAGAFTLTPELSARYYYNAGDTTVGTTASLIGAPGVPFKVTATGLGRNIGVLAAGLSAQQTSNLKISAQYELQVADDLTAQTVSLGLRYTW